MPALAVLAVFWMLTVDATTRLSLGPISVSGIVTVSTAAILLALSPLLLPLGKVRRVGGRVPLPLSIFGGMALVSLLVAPSVEGAQNVSVYASFILAVALGSLQQPSSSEALLSPLRLVAVVATVAYLATKALGVELYSDRAFGLVSLVFLAVLIPRGKGGMLTRVAPFLVVAAAALSLSRTATLIAVALLLFLAVRHERRWRLPIAVLTGALGILFVYWIITAYEPFRERFLAGDAAFQVGGLVLNTSGRSAIWEVVLNSAAASPIVGRGPGTASALLETTYGFVAHPHNEYLRLYHDFGFIGLALFVAGMLMLLKRVLDRVRHHDDPIHWAALMGLLAVLAAALTDNPIVYPFVMVPIGVIVGVSLSTPVAPRLSRSAGLRQRSALAPEVSPDSFASATAMRSIRPARFQRPDTAASTPRRGGAPREPS